MILAIHRLSFCPSTLSFSLPLTPPPSPTYREVVVAGRHVCELASLVHADEASIKVRGGGCVELGAVGVKLLDVVDVVAVLREECRNGHAVLLIDEGHAAAQQCVVEKGLSMFGQLSIFIYSFILILYALFCFRLF